MFVVGGCSDPERDGVIGGLKELQEQLRGSGQNSDADALGEAIASGGANGAIDLFTYTSPGMTPTMVPDERFAVRALGAADLERGDIVAFHPTRAALDSCGVDPPEASTLFVKRVVGLPRERVEVRAGVNWITVDGERFTAPNAGENPGQGSNAGSDRGTFVVPDGTVLVLGDNRGDSCDSHFWSDPYVPIENVTGRVLGVYFPVEAARLVR